METFDFYMDCKVTCWERTRFSIKANSYEEAKSIILSWEDKDVNSHIGMDENVIYCDYELNNPTMEIYGRDDELFYHNMLDEQ